MKTYTKRRKLAYDCLIAVKCNSCQEDLFNSDSGPFNVHEFKVENAFGDKFDLETHEFDLCDKCYCKIIKKFKIPPTVRRIYADR